MDFGTIEGEFDVVVTQRVLINLSSWEDQKRALLNVHRVLNPGGRYIMIENTNDAFLALNDTTAVQISWAEQRRLLKTREKASPKGCSGDQVAALDKIEIMLLSQLGLHSRQ